MTVVEVLTAMFSRYGLHSDLKTTCVNNLTNQVSGIFGIKVDYVSIHFPKILVLEK